MLWEAAEPSLADGATGAMLTRQASCPLAPLARLLRGEEALELSAHLQPEDLSSLMCTTSWWSARKDRLAVWHGYFVLRWGVEHGVGRRTMVEVVRSWGDDAWPAPWPLAVGFCGACSALDHTFWFLPFVRCALADRWHRVPPLPREFGWHVASVVRAQATQMHNRSRHDGAGRLARCFICDVLEVAPAGPAPQHFRQRWARPCKCKAFRLAHRQCLERKLRQAYRERLDLHCEACGHSYCISGRFPETLAELCWATVLEWRWLFRRVLVMLAFFSWMYLLALYYCVSPSTEGSQVFSGEFCSLLMVTACMMSITMSQRFHCSVQLIWNTPHRRLYFRLFALLAVLFYLVSLRAIDPRLWESAASNTSWLQGLHALHCLIHGSRVGAAVLSCMSMLYLATASGVIFLFWKTSLRVPTVADVSLAEDDVPAGAAFVSHAIAGEDACGLCQLGLCLDNTYM